MKTLCAILIAALCATAAPQSDVRAKERELETLKQRLAAARDSLQNEIAARWRDKQRAVEQREADKEELERLREVQERTYSDLSRVKEEGFARERQIEDESAEAARKRDEWEGLGAAVGECLDREAASLAGTFPLDLETRRGALEEIRGRARGSRESQRVVDQYSAYLAEYLKRGAAVAIDKQTVMPDDGAPHLMSVARFGNLCAYCLAPRGSAVCIRQTGRLGDQRYAVVALPEKNSPLTDFILQAMPSWISRGAVSGPVLFDVLQNYQSSLLLSGQRVSWLSGAMHSIRQGGATMIPLLLLPLWALWILGDRVVALYGRRRRFRRHYRAAMAFIDKKDFNGAAGFLSGQRGAMAEVLRVCIERRGGDRVGCERAVREIVVHEVPAVNRNINTMAVIAGAAPLLGLLGTISGMITLFAAVTHYGTGDPKFLAGGISEALITAKTGLAIAIPALFAHDILRSAKERLLSDFERYATHTLNTLWPEE